MATKQPIAPMQSPAQSRNMLSPTGEAARVTELPWPKAAPQVPGQSMPGGIDITLPLPVTLTERKCVPLAGSAIDSPAGPHDGATTPRATTKATAIRMAAPFDGD